MSNWSTHALNGPARLVKLGPQCFAIVGTDPEVELVFNTRRPKAIKKFPDLQRDKMAEEILCSLRKLNEQDNAVACRLFETAPREMLKAAAPMLKAATAGRAADEPATTVQSALGAGGGVEAPKAPAKAKGKAKAQGKPKAGGSKEGAKAKGMPR